MKKIKLLVIGFLFSLNSIAQQTPLSDVITFNLPKGAEKLSKYELQFPTLRTAKKTELDIKHGIGEFYKVKGVFDIIKLNGNNAITPANFLEKKKKGLDALYQTDGTPLPPHYESYIKSINNYKAVIITYAGESVSYYMFFSANNTHTSTLAGVMEFKESNRENATIYFEKILNGIKFKQ